MSNVSTLIITERGQVFWEHDGCRYCTNDAGEGIFTLNREGVRGRQIAGTGQFSLNGARTPRVIRYRINKYFGEKP